LYGIWHTDPVALTSIIDPAWLARGELKALCITLSGCAIVADLDFKIDLDIGIFCIGRPCQLACRWIDLCAARSLLDLPCVLIACIWILCGHAIHQTIAHISRLRWLAADHGLLIALIYVQFPSLLCTLRWLGIVTHFNHKLVISHIFFIGDPSQLTCSCVDFCTRRSFD
jgi:hypothetical protein